nr:glutathione S-transferase [Alsobacter ponti]
MFGRITSTNVQKVVFALEVLGLAYERRDAGGAFGVVGTPEYLARNPNGLVPTLEDDGLVLWESNSIVRYLAARYGRDTLWVDDPGQRALAERWMDWQIAEFAPAMGPAFMHLVRTPAEKRDPAIIEASRVKAERLLGILDAHLAGRDALEHGRLTMADIVLAPNIHRWLNMPIARQPHPNVERWYARLRALPAAARALPLPVS